MHPLATGEKAQDLLTEPELLMLFTLKGDTVFDPAFGSGSMMEHCRHCHTTII
jgi:hypothetical protein